MLRDGNTMQTTVNSQLSSIQAPRILIPPEKISKKFNIFIKLVQKQSCNELKPTHHAAVHAATTSSTTPHPPLHMCHYNPSDPEEAN
jgi:hypothetical protein